MKKVLVFSILLFTASAFAAGGQFGNGGSGVVCFKDQKIRDEVQLAVRLNEDAKTPSDWVDPLAAGRVDNILTPVVLYDLFIETKGGFTGERKIIDSQLPFLQIANTQLELLKSKSKFYDEIIVAQGQLHPKNWIGVENGIVAVNDTGAQVFLPANCMLLQIAIQDAKQSRIYYDTRLFSKLSPTGQAAIYLHELIYNVALNLADKHSDSRGTQKVTATLFLEEFAEMSGHDFDMILQQAQFGHYNYTGRTKMEFLDIATWMEPTRKHLSRWIFLSPVAAKMDLFTDKGIAISFDSSFLPLAIESLAKIPSLIGQLTDDLVIGQLRIAKGSWLTFGLAEHPRSVTNFPVRMGIGSNYGSIVCQSGAVGIGNGYDRKIEFLGGETWLYESHRLKSCSLSKNTVVNGIEYNQDLTLFDSEAINVKVGQLAKEQNVHGISLAAGDIEFCENGRVAKATSATRQRIGNKTYKMNEKIELSCN